MDARTMLAELAAAASRGDLDAIDRLGRNARVTESFGRMLTAFPDVSVTPEWILQEGSRAAGFAAIRGTHRGVWRGLAPTGRSVDVHGMVAVEVGSDGSVADLWIANDWLSIATQLGVRLELPSV